MMPAQPILDPDTLPTSGQRWDGVIMGLFAGVLAFAPAAFGAVEAWSELIVLLAAAALSVCVALRVIFDREFRPARTWLYVPLALFIVLVAFQLAPLPAEFVRWLSPATVEVKQQMLGEVFQPMRKTALSFYPLATAKMLRLLLIGTAVFVAVASVVRNPRRMKTLLAMVFAIGCAEAVLAISQIATAADSIYWRVPTGRGVATSGTFVNYSHFCQFMNLSLGAGIGLLLVQLHEQRRHEIRGDTWRDAIARIQWEKHGWLFFGIGLCAITVFTSMSRSGAISLVVAGAVVGAALYRRGSLNWRGWLLGAVPLGVLTGLFIFGFDAVYERLATLKQTAAYEGRWEMTAATLRAWRAYPIWGTGLGTHEFVFPMFDKAVTPVVAAHADNDYAQLLEEMGVAGAVLVAAFLVGIATLAVHLAVRGRTPSSAAVYGLGFGLLAVAIHSASDFGQRLPANFCLSATLCGLLVAIARIEARDRPARHGHARSARPIAPWVRRTVAAVAATGLAAVGIWAGRHAYAAYLGERWWAASLTMESRIRQDLAQATDQDYVDLIAAAAGAFQSEPDNVNYGYGLNSYRWQSLSRAVDPDTGQVVLHPGVVPFVARIADDLSAVRWLCPTYGPPYALEGQLRLFVLNDPQGAELIRKGVRLAPYDPPTCLVAGELAAREGNLDEAAPLLTRAVELQPAYFREVVDIYLREAQRPDLARGLAGDDYWRLEELARACAESGNHAEMAEDLRAAATASLRRRAEGHDAKARELATLARIDHEQGDVASAIELYRRALGQDYRQIEWRLNLARALATSGEIDEAIHEVRVCLRLRPQYPPATKLLEELTSGTGDADN